MGQETAKRDWGILFQDVRSRDYLEYLATEWGSELVPTMQAELRNMIGQRENMRVGYEEEYTLLKKQVAEAEALSQSPDFDRLQAARKKTVELAESLERKREQLQKLDREIAERADSLVKETRGSSPKSTPKPKRRIS
jgi:hypothetical protein